MLPFVLAMHSCSTAPPIRTLISDREDGLIRLERLLLVDRLSLLAHMRSGCHFGSSSVSAEVISSVPKPPLASSRSEPMASAIRRSRSILALSRRRTCEPRAAIGRPVQPWWIVDETPVTINKRLIGHSYRSVGSNWLCNRGKEQGFHPLSTRAVGRW